MKVSVALCSYNGEKFLAEQLKSIFQQSYAVDEIVICDDGSSDNTIKIINEFQSQHSGIIRLFINEKNLGGRKNFEKAFSLCTGDVIFFSDQDDVWEQDKVKIIVKFFRENSECWGVASDASLIDGNGKNFDSSFWKSINFEFEDTTRLVKNGFCEYLLTCGNIVSGAMLAVRKEAKPYIYPFKFLTEMWHDEWIVIVLSSMDKFALIKDKLIKYRIHKEQQIGLGAFNDKEFIAYVNLLKDSDKLKSLPLSYLSHSWRTYEKFKRLQAEVKDLIKFKAVFVHNLQDSKRIFLKQQNLLLRKARLLKWYVNKEFDTTLKDVFTL